MRALPSILATTNTNARASVYGAVGGAEFAVDNVVEDRLEVVKEDGVRGALEDESKTPVWVDATAGCDTSGGYGGVCEKECYREELVSSSVVCTELMRSRAYHAE